MKKIAVHILIFMLVMSLAGYATAAQEGAAEAPQITSITIMDNAVELAVSGDFTYTAYKPSDPFTVAVDLPDVDKGSFGGKMTSDKTGISEVNVSGTSAPAVSTKLEILLESPSDIKAVRTDNTLLIKIEKTEAQKMAEAAARRDEVMMAQAQRAPASSSGASLRPATEINDVNFDYSEGTLNLVIQGNGAVVSEVFSLDGRIVIDFSGVTMTAEMPAAVVTPVKSVRHGMHNGEVRMVVDLRQAVDFNAVTEDDRLLISFPAEEVLEILSAEEAPAEALIEEAPKPAVAEEAVGKYTGKIISLDFQNADIVPIFRFIGDISGYNVVVHPTVGGTVTLKLNNVPWDQALDIILNLYGLEKQVEGNIMTIAPATIFDRIAKEKAQLKSTEAVTAELVRKIIHLKYIDAADMGAKISDERALGPRGIMTVDEKGNNLRIRDTEENLERVMEVVGDYDRPLYGKQQVMIEAKIILIDSTYDREIGIDWSADFGVQMFGTPVTGSFSINDPLGDGSKGGTATAAIPGAFTGIAPYASLNLAISALEDIGDSKTLANPRVLTIDTYPAQIQSGTQIPVTTTTAEGSTTEFINANLSLKVTPTIKPNGIIEIEVEANKDEPIQVGSEIGIETNSVSTTARVKDGQTLVIGGIYENTKDNPKSGIPGLRKIPILGWLFGKESIIERTDELMILITPTIIKSDDEDDS